MKLRHTLSLTFLLIVSLPLWAGNIAGRIVDSGTKLGIEFAKISVYSTPENKFIKAIVAGKKGEFSIQSLPDGKYILKAAFIGYSAIQLPFQLDARHNNLQLHNLELTPTTQNLKQIEVTGKKSQVRFEIDRKVYSVEQNVAVAGGSATEILRTIPSVEVASDGNVLLRNNPNVIIWINGRPSGLNDDNRAQVLEQLPAETIDKIEIITNPSSKYSPDGSAGIINIVLKKTTKSGRSGSVSAGTDTNGGYNASLNVYYSHPQWEINANAGYRNDVRNMQFNSDRLTFNSATNDTVTRYSRDKVKINGGGLFARSNITWHASPNDDLVLSGMVTTAHRVVSEQIGNQRLKDGAERVDYRYTDAPTQRNLYSVSLDYIHKFNDKGREFRAYAEQSVAMADANQQVRQMDSLMNTRYYQWGNSTATRKETTLQLDYTHPFSASSKLELGYKGEYQTRETTIRASYGLLEATKVPQHQLDNDFGGSDNRNSLYINFSGKIKKLSFQLGLRGEYNVMKNKSVVYDANGTDSVIHFNYNYPGIYPSVFLDYALPADNKLQLNYTRRINRPKGRMTNPFRSVADSANIEFGNPDLRPEHSNVFELSHIKSWDEHMLSTVLYYRTTGNVIQGVNYVETQGKYDIKFITSKNITNAQAGGVEWMLKNKFFKTIDLTSSVNLFYNHLDGFEYAGTWYKPTKTMGWSGRVSVNTTLPGGITAQASAGYQSRKNIAQGETLPVWGVDAGVRKAFLDKKLLVNLNVRDLFNSRLNRDVTTGYNFYDYSEYRLNASTVGVVVSYNFGSPSKKTEKTKENDNPLNGDF